MFTESALFLKSKNHTGSDIRQIKMELKVQKANAVNAYNNGSNAIKKVLCDIFGRETFEPFVFDEIDEVEKKVLAAYSRLRKKAKEKRGDWEPDFSNSNQKKYFPWLEYKQGSGFGFSDADCIYDYSGTHVGSRLCFPTSDMAMEFAKENLEDYNIIFSN